MPPAADRVTAALGFTKNQPPGFEKIFGAETGAGITVLGKYTNGFADIKLLLVGGGGNDYTFFEFSGGRYREQ